MSEIRIFLIKCLVELIDGIIKPYPIILIRIRYLDVVDLPAEPKGIGYRISKVFNIGDNGDVNNISSKSIYASRPER